MPVSPLRLCADNFTPPARTPWGGTRILSHYKAGLGLAASGVVGEAWEISVEPSFPSRARDGRLLAHAIAEAPVAWLGERAVRRYGRATPLLVKLLDAAEPLSVQVHPADGDPALAADESGKPEAWIVLDAEPGAGLYLGCRDGVGAREVRACLAAKGPLDELMGFVPVAPGDAFVIEAGTPHAIGRGVTLLEPQLVRPGRRGLTYRFWDWNRRYDAHGRLDPSGAPRELHVERSLAVATFSGGDAARFVAACRATAGEWTPRTMAGAGAAADAGVAAAADAGVAAEVGAAVDAGGMQRRVAIAWRWLEVEEWRGTGALTLDCNDAMTAVVCVGGALTVDTELGSLVLACGESGVIPAAARTRAVRGTAAHAFAIEASAIEASAIEASAIEAR